MQPSDYGFSIGSAGARQISDCLTGFNGYFDPNGSGVAPASSLCVLPSAGPAGINVPVCTPDMVTAVPKALP